MQIGLKKLLRKSNPSYELVVALLQSFGNPLSVFDEDGLLLLGLEREDLSARLPVLCDSSTAGWVAGSQPDASTLVQVLERMLTLEDEKRSLSDELLDSYRELNVLYNLSEHLLAAPEPALIASTALHEIERLITVSGAWVLILDHDTDVMAPIASVGSSLSLKSNVASSNIVTSVLARNEAEIYNNINSSHLLQGAVTKQIALLCAPLKTEHRALGAVMLIGESPISFSARDLKLLNTVALQTGPAIEMARLYQVAVVQGRMEHELQMAYEVQASLIPAQPLSFSETGWEFAGRWRPARELSGDYYDFIPHGQDIYGLVIADVADKGLPSALFMVNTRSAVRAAVDRVDSPAAAISDANRLVSREATDGLFVTMFYGQLNSHSGKFTYVNAGHNPALLYRAKERKLTELSRTGIPLGILPSADYTQRNIQLQPGDAVIFYTDGVTEAMNPDNDEFGMSRLRAIILEHQGAHADMLAGAIESAVGQFTASAPYFDDFTLMIVRRQPS